MPTNNLGAKTQMSMNGNATITLIRRCQWTTLAPKANTLITQEMPSWHKLLLFIVKLMLKYIWQLLTEVVRLNMFPLF
jgi:hypothetical protein